MVVVLRCNSSDFSPPTSNGLTMVANPMVARTSVDKLDQNSGFLGSEIAGLSLKP